MENNELYHHGVLGMKWGVRKARSTPSTDHTKVQQIRKKKISQMSNQELNDANKRLQLESQYKQLTKKTNVGKKAVQAFVSTAGTIAAVAGAYTTYKKIGLPAAKKAVEAIGRFAVDKVLNKGLNKPWM